MALLATAFDNLATDLRALANPEKAQQMQAYMKDRFPFLGVPGPERKVAQKPFLAAARRSDMGEILDAADRCWEADEREFQYVGCDLLRARAQVLRPGDLDRLHHFIITKSWWDTVDTLACHPVGTLISHYPELATVMDEWIDDANIWVARTAILHQLTYKDRADQDRLFRYAVTRAGDSEFFIRKALGWALRTHARVAPDAVREFVATHDEMLSGLTKREAMKHLLG